MIRAVTVYCSSSAQVAGEYFAAARELGRSLVANRWSLVYGGNRVGVMEALAESVRAAGGKVIGITPQFLVDKGISDRMADELVVTATMRQRKELMEQRGDAFIAMPGGLGTFEEIFEIIAGKSLRCHDKPVVLLDVAGYYRPLIEMIEHGIERRFIKARARDLYSVARDAAQAVQQLRDYRPPATPAIAPSALA